MKIVNIKTSASPSGTSIKFQVRFLEGENLTFSLPVYPLKGDISIDYIGSTFGWVYKMNSIKLNFDISREVFWKALVPEIEAFLKTGILEQKRQKTLNKRYKKKIDALIQECLKVGISKDEISQMIDENLCKQVVEG